jgi:hypothetical protein
MNRLLFSFIVSVIAGNVVAVEIDREKVETAEIVRGDLSVLFRDNSQSPKILSGVDSLFNTRAAKGFDAFDPDTPGASAGLNFEHIISGHSNVANAFAPRHGRYTLYKPSDGHSVILKRLREDCPWDVSSTMKYTLTAPHYIDVNFQCTPHKSSAFGKRGYAILFFADYMNDVADVPLHFLGVDSGDAKERWISADGPKGQVDWNGGGTYRQQKAADLEYDATHNFKLNIWSYDYPRYTKPFYYGRAANDMVLIIMFNKSFAAEDEIRFSIFKFKLPKKQRPAWDFQYVIHKVEENRKYGFEARVVWKKFVSSEDCRREYERWSKSLAKEK